MMEDGFIRGAVGGHGGGWFRKGTQRTNGTEISNSPCGRPPRPTSNDGGGGAWGGDGRRYGGVGRRRGRRRHPLRRGVAATLLRRGVAATLLRRGRRSHGDGLVLAHVFFVDYGRVLKKIIRAHSALGWAGRGYWGKVGSKIGNWVKSGKLILGNPRKHWGKMR